jgi:hypothetical protein
MSYAQRCPDFFDDRLERATSYRSRFGALEIELPIPIPVPLTPNKPHQAESLIYHESPDH